MTEEKLYDIEYWLPFNGGQYHCTVAVGVNQVYVDKVKEVYEKSLNAWRMAPSAWSLPFHHTMVVVPHVFHESSKSFVKVDEHNRLIKKAEEKGAEEACRRLAKQALLYMTNERIKSDFKRNFKRYFND